MSDDTKPSWLTPKGRRMATLADRDGGWRCRYCGIDLIPRTTPLEQAPVTIDRDGGCSALPGFAFPEIDHVHPRCLGGTDDADNLVLACGPCNVSKGTKTLQEWRR